MVSVEWGYELHSIQLTREQWAHMMGGNPLSIEGSGYWYEGEAFQDTWYFAGGIGGELRVTYARFGADVSDEGHGFVGALRDAVISTPDPPGSLGDAPAV